MNCIHNWCVCAPVLGLGCRLVLFSGLLPYPRLSPRCLAAVSNNKRYRMTCNGLSRQFDGVASELVHITNPSLGAWCLAPAFGSHRNIGRADIEGSKSNVAMNAWLPQASSFLPSDEWGICSPFYGPIGLELVRLVSQLHPFRWE